MVSDVWLSLTLMLVLVLILVLMVLTSAAPPAAGAASSAAGGLTPSHRGAVAAEKATRRVPHGQVRGAMG